MAAGAGWSNEETRTLLGVWGAADVQSQLDGVVRNKTIYEKITAALCDVGYERTWQQCKTKIKNMVQRYNVKAMKWYIEKRNFWLFLNQVKDGNNISGTDRKTCPFYDELDAILGTRAASSPPVLLDSGGESHSATASINDGVLCMCIVYFV